MSCKLELYIIFYILSFRVSTRSKKISLDSLPLIAIVITIAIAIITTNPRIQIQKITIIITKILLRRRIVSTNGIISLKRSLNTGYPPTWIEGKCGNISC